MKHVEHEFLVLRGGARKWQRLIFTGTAKGIVKRVIDQLFSFYMTFTITLVMQTLKIVMMND